MCVCVCPLALSARLRNGRGHQLRIRASPLLRNRQIGVSTNREGFSRILVKDRMITFFG